MCMVAGVVKSVRPEASPSASPTDKDHRLAFTNRRVKELDIFADNVDTILEVRQLLAPDICMCGRPAAQCWLWQLKQTWLCGPISAQLQS